MEKKRLGLIGSLVGILVACLLVAGGIFEVKNSVPNGHVLLYWGLLCLVLFMVAAWAAHKGWRIALAIMGGFTVLFGLVSIASIGMFLVPVGAVLLVAGLSPSSK